MRVSSNGLSAKQPPGITPPPPPSLAAPLAEIADTFPTLPGPEQDALYARVASLEADLRAQVMTRRQSQPAGPGTVYEIKDAADRLLTSPDSLYRKHKRLKRFTKELVA